LTAIRELPAPRLTGPVEIRGVVFRKPAKLRMAWDG
jgi:hypothetical protein